MSADGDTQKQRRHPEQRRTSRTTAGMTGTLRQPAAPATVPAGVLPNKAAEDDPRRWGDEPGGYDHDSWLQEQKPPHWG